jgi:hypothetical protein
MSLQVFDCITSDYLYTIGQGAGSGPGQMNGPFRLAIELPEPGTCTWLQYISLQVKSVDYLIVMQLTIPCFL